MSPPTPIKRLLSELRRRRVYPVTFAYGVVAWLILQVADIVVEPLSLPSWTLTLVIVVLALGLPLVVVLAWLFDLTPHGIEVTPAADDLEPPRGNRAFQSSELEGRGAWDSWGGPGRIGGGAEGVGDAPLGKGARVSRFQIMERLGEGGMGLVYRALDTALDRTVALKVLPPHLTRDEEAERRFLLEARAAARLDHPNICTIHEIGSLDTGGSFIAMALYEGHTLSELLEERDRLPVHEVTSIGAQVAKGLTRAHEVGIVHRDIKPGNLMITPDGVVKILDFGIAKMAGIDLTEAGAALGTVSYMSPEQVRGQTVEPRTDLWALGVVMYEGCSGVQPFIGLDRAAVLHGILELDPPPLVDMIPGFPPELWSLIEHCLEKAPENRPRSAEDVASTLDELSTTLRHATVAASGTRTTVRPEPGLAAEGERRQATVLAAELAGVGRLEESLLPEESRHLIDACRVAMTEIVTAYGGVVNRNDGETLQALFGIPVAREDDAKRAVLAGRALCHQVAEIVGKLGDRGDVGLRCGIDTRRVVVRKERTSRSRYRVVGAAVDLSVRLAAHARTGEVLISQDCHRLVAPFFELERGDALPGRDGEGLSETYRVLGETGVRTRLEGLAASRALSELTGRQSELETLLASCESVLSGQGRFVSIVGEAGVGKSRLLYELDTRIDRSRFNVVHGRCQSFGVDTPYLPFVDALRDQLDLPADLEREGSGVVAERVVAVSPDLERFVPYYLQLLSVKESEAAAQEGWGAEGLRMGLVESLSALVTLGAQQKPTVLMLEDWHWVDAASNQVLVQLLEMVSAYPLLIVATARPDADLDWSGAMLHTPIVLAPLGLEESASVVRSALEADEVPGPVLHFLHQRTGGNPFFLEEVCQALREDGTLQLEGGRVSVAGTLDSVQLPDTVQGVLRTRLDRLDGAARRMVRYASVIGREFDLQVLTQALDEDAGRVSLGLDLLRELGLIQQIRVVPAPTYRFKHALTQEVAYDSLLERQRSSIHGAVGDALEAVYPDRIDEQLDRLAEHFAHAGRWDKAVEYGVSAADRRWSFSEFQEAAEANARALECVKHLPESRQGFERQVELLLRQERLFEHMGLRARQQEIIDELTAILDPEHDPHHLATTYVRQGDLLILTGEPERAESSLGEALRLSDAAGAGRVKRNALRSLGLLRWRQERHEEALGHVEESTAIDRELGDEESLISNLVNLSVLHRALGSFDLALADLAEALERERNITHRGLGVTVKEGFILQNMSIIYSAMGDNERALEFLEEARAIGDRSAGTVVNVVQMHYHLIAMARLHLEAGRLDECLALYRESVAQTRKARHVEGLAQSLRLLGEVLLNLDRYEEALPALEEAGELFSGLRDTASEARMWRGVAISRQALARSDGAREAWERAAELADAISDDMLAREAAEGTATLLRSSDPAAARKAYARALTLAKDAGDVEKQGRLEYHLGLIDWEQRDFEGALASFGASFLSLTQVEDEVHAGLVLNSIGRTLRDLGRPAEARDRLVEAIRLNRSSGERLLEAHAEATLGDVLLDLDQPEEGAAHFKAALEIRKSLEDPAGEAWMLCALVRAHRAMGSHEGAAYYLDEAGSIASRLNDPELASVCRALEAELTGEIGED